VSLLFRRNTKRKPDTAFRLGSICHGALTAIKGERSVTLLQFDAEWCTMVWTEDMATTEKSMRQSVSLPAPIAKRVKALAKNQKTSTNRVLVELIETGLESKEAEKRRFFALADRLSISTDEKERERIKKELAKLTFGE
jgi:predicted DNA-binding protein